MTNFQRFLVLAATIFLVGAAAYAQSVISAHSGLLNYTEGDVFLQDKQVEPSLTKFPEMKNGDQLRTEEGRAEVLLTPGVVLRVNEKSSIKMISNKLTSTRVELVTGSAIVECAELSPGTDVTLVFQGATVAFAKRGVVRLDSDPASVKVYSGEVIVAKEGQSLTLKEGKETLLKGVLQAEKFDNKVGDNFYRWAARRDGDLAAANIAAARSVQQNGNYYGSSGWGFNQLLGMYTYLPGRGTAWSPFGYPYYSGYTIGGYYDNYYNYYNPTNSYSGGGSRSSGNRNTSVSYNPSLGYNTGSRAAVYNSNSNSYSSGVSNSGSSSAVSSPAVSSRGSDGGGAGRGDSGGAGRGGR